MQKEMNKSNISLKVERENASYAKILMQDFSGTGGALSAVLRFAYQQMIQKEPFESFRLSLVSLQMMKTTQFECFGKLIDLLGGNPVYGTLDSKIPRLVPYTTCGFCYLQDPAQFLAYDIKQEEQTLERYIAHRNLIHDVYIGKIFDTFIEQEQIILEKLRELLAIYRT